MKGPSGPCYFWRDSGVTCSVLNLRACPDWCGDTKSRNTTSSADSYWAVANRRCQYSSSSHEPQNAVFLVLIGTLLLAILLAADFIKTVSGVLNDVVPAMALLRSLVYLLASLSMVVYFYVFNRSQAYQRMPKQAAVAKALRVHRAAACRTESVL